MNRSYKWRRRECTTNGRTFVNFDGRTWPLPQPELSYSLRYAGHSIEPGTMVTVPYHDTIGAATVMDAFQALIETDAADRELVVYAIRRAMREVQSAPSSSESGTGGDK